MNVGVLDIVPAAVLHGGGPVSQQEQSDDECQVDLPSANALRVNRGKVQAFGLVSLGFFFPYGPLSLIAIP